MRYLGTLSAVSKGIVRDYYSVFEAADTSKDGRISRREFACALRDLKVSIDSGNEDAIVRAFDVDGSGTLEYEEFARAVEYGRRRLRLVELKLAIESGTKDESACFRLDCCFDSLCACVCMGWLFCRARSYSVQFDVC